MGSKPPYVAFFDLDETLLAKNSGRVFWEYCLEKKIYSPVEIGFLGFSLLKFAVGFDETEDFIRSWASVFKGWTETKMHDITREVFEQRIKPVIRSAAENEVQRHKAAGALTVILSASTRFVCHPVRDYLGMDDALCTALAIEGGEFTGKLASPYIFGEQKYLSALSYCHENGYDLSSCYYYGDAFTDRFVMEAVGHPVCVTPDRKLRAYAQNKNWNVVEW